MPRISKAKNKKERISFSQGGARGQTQLRNDGDFEFPDSQVNLGTTIEFNETDNIKDGDEEEDEEEEEEDVVVLGGLKNSKGRVSITPGPIIRSKKRKRTSVTPIIADEVEKEEEVLERNEEKEEKEQEEDDTFMPNYKEDDDKDDDIGFRKGKSSKKKKRGKVARKSSKPVPPPPPILPSFPKNSSRKRRSTPLLLSKVTPLLPSKVIDDNDDNYNDDGISIGRSRNDLLSEVVESVDIPIVRTALAKKIKRQLVEVPFGNMDRVAGVQPSHSIPIASLIPISTITEQLPSEIVIPISSRNIKHSANVPPPPPFPPLDPRIVQKAKAEALVAEERLRIPRFDFGIIIGRNKKLLAVSHGARANLLTVAWVLGERIEAKRKESVPLRQIVGARWRDISGKKQISLSLGSAVSSEKLMEVFGFGNVLILKATDDLIHILSEAEHVSHPDFVSVIAESARMKESDLYRPAVLTYSVGIRAQEIEICAPSILDLFIDVNSAEATGSFEARKQLFHLKKVSAEEQVLQTSIEFRFVLVALNEQSRELYYALEKKTEGDVWLTTVAQARTVVKKAILQTFTDSRKGGPVSFVERAPVKKPVSSRSMSKFADRKTSSMARAILEEKEDDMNSTVLPPPLTESFGDFPLLKNEKNGLLNRERSISIAPTTAKVIPVIPKVADKVQSQWIDKFVLGSEDTEEFTTFPTGDESSSSSTTLLSSSLNMNTLFVSNFSTSSAPPDPSLHFLTTSNMPADIRNRSSVEVIPNPPPPPPPLSRQPAQQRSQSQAACRTKRLAEQKAKEDAEMSEFDVTALAALRESIPISVFAEQKIFAEVIVQAPINETAVLSSSSTGGVLTSKPIHVRRFADLKPREKSDRDIFEDF